MAEEQAEKVEGSRWSFGGGFPARGKDVIVGSPRDRLGSPKAELPSSIVSHVMMMLRAIIFHHLCLCTMFVGLMI